MMRNRYGDEYHFEKVEENLYTIVGDLKYWRYGGNDGEDSVDYTNLGFVDPSGGPFIGRGYMIEGRKVVNISMVKEKILFKVEP
jgi:hypothetical protein